MPQLVLDEPKKATKEPRLILDRSIDKPAEKPRLVQDEPSIITSEPIPPNELAKYRDAEKRHKANLAYQTMTPQQRWLHDKGYPTEFELLMKPAPDVDINASNQFGLMSGMNIPRKRSLDETFQYNYEQLDPQDPLRQKVDKIHTLQEAYTKALTSQRRQFKGFWDELGRNIASGSLNISGALLSEFADVSHDSLMWTPEQIQGVADWMYEKSKSKSLGPSALAEDANWWDKTKQFSGMAIGQALPYMVASTGATLATGTPLSAFGVGYVVEGENAYREAKEAGASEEHAQMNKLIVGTLNGAIESLQVSDIIKFAKNGKGSIKSVLKAAKQRAWKEALAAGKELSYQQLEHILRESLEEALQETVSVGAQATVEPDVIKDAPKRIGSATLGGGVAGWALGSAGNVVDSRSDNKKTQLVPDGFSEQVTRKLKQAAAEEYKHREQKKTEAQDQQEQYVRELDDEYNKIIQKPTSETTAQEVQNTDAVKPVEKTVVEQLQEKIREAEAGPQGGISQKRRGSLINYIKKQISEHPIYQDIEQAFGIKQQSIGGKIYIPKEYLGEIESVIGERFKKGANNQAWSYITHTPGTGLHYDEIGHQIGETDVNKIVEHIASAAASKTEKQFNMNVLEEAKNSGEPYLNYLADKLEMLESGSDVDSIDTMTDQFIETYDISTDDFWQEYLGSEPLKLSQIKQIPDAAKRERQLEILAEQNVRNRKRQQAVEAVNQILGDNGITLDVEQVDEIPIADEDGVSYERKGKKATGAYLNRAGREIVQLAYGADSETGYHEGFHAIKQRLTKRDNQILDRHYPDEEAQAKAYAKFAEDNSVPTNMVRFVFKKIQRLLTKIKSALQGRGFRTVEDIFGEINKGTIKKQRIVKITGYELGKYNNKVELRKKAKKYASENLKGKHVTVLSTNEDIEIANSGIRHALSSNNENKIKSIVAIPQLIENSVKIKVEADRNNNPQIKNIHKYRSALKMRGVAHDIIIVVKEKADGHKYYDHYKEIKAASAESGFDRKGQVGQSIAGTASTNIIRQKSDKGKGKTKYEIKNPELKAEIHAEKERLAKRAGLRKKVSRAKLRVPFKDTTPLIDQRFKEPELPEGKKIAIRPIQFRRTIPVEDQKVPEKMYEANRHNRALANAKESIKDIFKEVGVGVNKIITSVSYRLHKINPELKRRIRSREQAKLERTAEDLKAVEPLLKALKKMKRADYKDFDLAWKNGDKDKINELAKKYKFTNALKAFRQVDEQIYTDALSVGMDVAHRKDHLHRRVKHAKKFYDLCMKRFGNSNILPKFEAALAKRREQTGGRALSMEEQASVLNTTLRGFSSRTVFLSRPGATKERSVFMVDPEMNKCYHDTKAAIVMYITDMQNAISAREFFGKESEEILKLRAQKSRLATRLHKLQTRQGRKQVVEEGKHKEHISTAMEKFDQVSRQLDDMQHRDLSESIGGYVLDLVVNKQIKPEQEDELQKLLKAYFDPARTGRIAGFFKKVAYLTHLGQVTNTLTQLKDYGRILYRAPVESFNATMRAIIPGLKSKYQMEDLGLEDVNVDVAGLSSMLDMTLTATGFRRLDKKMKEIYVDAVITQYQKQAKRKKLSTTFRERIEDALGSDAQQCIADLKAGKKSELVKKLAFNEILDMHPLALSEMTEAYLKSGGFGRYMYTLRTFALKEMEYLRGEILRDIKKYPARNLARLVWMAFTLAVAGAGVEALKDFIRGRKFNLGETVIDNWLNLVFLSRYNVDVFRRKGLEAGTSEILMPPMGIMGDIVDDLRRGKFEETPRRTPLVGELYYWHAGRGKEKTEKQKTKGGGIF